MAMKSERATYRAEPCISWIIWKREFCEYATISSITRLYDCIVSTSTMVTKKSYTWSVNE